MTSPQIDELIAQLSERRGGRRQAARETLVDIGGPAVPALLPLATSKAKRLRWEVIKTLASIADPRAIPVLVRRLADTESGIRWLAAVGLIDIGPASVAPVLRFVIDHPESIEVRRAAHHVFHDLAAEDDELQEILAPVLYTLGDVQPTEAIPPTAREALHKVEPL